MSYIAFGSFQMRLIGISLNFPIAEILRLRREHLFVVLLKFEERGMTAHTNLYAYIVYPFLPPSPSRSSHSFIFTFTSLTITRMHTQTLKHAHTHTYTTTNHPHTRTSSESRSKV